MQNEKKIEQRLVKKVKEMGGLCLKWVSPSMTGVPDRLVFYNSQVIPVELKDPKGKLSARQEFMFLTLLNQGVVTHVLASEQEVDEFVDQL